MKKLLFVLLIIALLFVGYRFFSLNKECVDIFSSHACIHGIRVDGQWFDSASKLTLYLMFSRGMLFKSGQFEYFFHENPLM